MINVINVFPNYADFHARVQVLEGNSHANLQLKDGVDGATINLFGREDDIELLRRIAELMNEAFGKKAPAIKEDAA
jgi:hypothetical protein